MNHYDTILNELRIKIARKNHLQSTHADMLAQKVALEQKVKDLETSKLKEEHDVKKIEGGSLASFFYNVVGKRDEKLDKKRQEAYEARVKYDAAFSELTALNNDIYLTEQELERLVNCESEYEMTFAEKSTYLKNTNPQIKEQMQSLEEQISGLTGQEVEITEAITAGQSALLAAETALKHLDDADGLSTWDMLGGGLLIDLAKHEALDDAQSNIESLQISLRRFKTELADVTIDADIDVRIDGFLHFADFFFDNIFTDWAVSSQIEDSYISVKNTKEQIKKVLNKLQEMNERVAKEKEELAEKMNQFVLDNKC